MHKKHLAAPFNLKIDRTGNKRFIIVGQVGLYGKPVFRGCFYYAQIPYSHHGHLECPWHRGGGYGQNIHQRPEFF